MFATRNNMKPQDKKLLQSSIVRYWRTKSYRDNVVGFFFLFLFNLCIGLVKCTYIYHVLL